MSALHVFDMDGTLLAGSSACLEVAAGEISTCDFAVAACRLWRDLTPADVTAAFTASPWLTGVTEVCDHHLASLAALDYRGSDLSGAYRLARTLLEPGRHS